MSDTIILPSENEKDPTFPQDQSPLLTIQQPDQQKIENDGESDTNLDKNLQRLDCLLTLLGFNHSSVLRLGISWTVFLLIGVALPVVVLELLNCPGCEKFQIKSFELDIIASQTCLAAVSLFCVSHNLRKYGIRKFLFVDRFSGQMERFSEYYIQKILVSSVVQVVGITLCLNAAAKISHRAQGIASIASRWHALAACSSIDSPHLRFSNSSGNMRHADSVELNYSESDLESLDHMTVPINTQVPSHTSSYHKRQAFVLYLQNNPGGITIYGWTVDRALINTIFFIQLSLVLFVLGKTIVFTSE